MQTTTMTEKQATYRAALIDQYLDHCAQQYATKKAGIRERYLMDAAFVAALPTPASVADASAQIDALKALRITIYAQQHIDWGTDVQSKIVAAWGSQPAAWAPVASRHNAIVDRIDIAATLAEVL